MLLRLDNDDRDKLMLLCRIGDTNQNDILRQLIRYAHEVEMTVIRAGKVGAA